MKPLTDIRHTDVSTTSYDCKVHTKISVWRPARSIGVSSNDSAPDPVRTTFLSTEGFKSSVQLPTSLLPTCKPETASLSGHALVDPRQPSARKPFLLDK